MDARSEFEAMVERALAGLLAYRGTYEGEQPVDAFDVAAALNAAGVPALLAEVERLNGELAALRADAESLRRCLRHAETELAALGGGGNGCG